MENELITKAEEILKSIKSLRLLMEKENKILEARDFDKLITFGKEKASLAETFHDLFQQLAAEKEKMHDLPPKLKQMIEHEWVLFNAVTTENIAALQKASTINQRLAERLLNVTREALKALEQSYNRSGQSTQAGSTAPLKYNETL